MQYYRGFTIQWINNQQWPKRLNICTYILKASCTVTQYKSTVCYIRKFYPGLTNLCGLLKQ